MSFDPQALGQQAGEVVRKYRGSLIVGGLIGLISGGLPGLFIGAAVAALLAKALVSFLTGGYSPQAIFFKATFCVMGKIAKADGRVSETEIQYAKDVMARMNLSPEKRKEAIDCFTEGKDEQFDIAQVLTPLSRLVQARPEIKIMFLEIQLQAAMADGEISQAEQAVLQQVCALLKMSGPEMSALLARMQAQQAFHQQSYHSHYQPGVSPAELLKEAYGVLGVAEAASDKEVKQAYRKLMSQHHPDKLVAKGLPPEMMDLAKEKTQEIQAAYDRIKTARKAA